MSNSCDTDVFREPFFGCGNLFLQTRNTSEEEFLEASGENLWTLENRCFAALTIPSIPVPWNTFVTKAPPGESSGNVKSNTMATSSREIA